MESNPILELLPSEPTLETCGNDQKLLDLKLKARGIVKTSLDLLDLDGWDLVKDENDITLWRISTADSSLTTIKK